MVYLSKPLNPEADPWAPVPVPTDQKPSLPSPPPVTRWLPSPPLLLFPHYKFRPNLHYFFPGFQTLSYYNTQLQPQPLPLPHLAEAQSPLPSTAAANWGGTAVKTTRVSNRSSRGRGVGQRSITLRKSSVWLPKNNKSYDKSYDKVADCVRSSPPRPPPSAPSHDNVLPLCAKTTVMVKNIPNQYRRNMLLSFLDKMCQEQNQKAKLESSPIRFEYDFLYLPMDFWRGDNLGYAFVNFTSAVAAKRIWELLQDYKWGVFKDSCGSLRGSKKICEITWARIQGKEELVRHFRNSNFACRNMEYLPVVLSPPRDGASSSLPNTIGRCLASS